MARILAVDDDDLHLRLYQRLLGDEHEVEVASRAEEGLRKAQVEPGFDAILVDFEMPEMNGEGLFQRLCSLDGSAADRVLFVTGDPTHVAHLGRPVLRKPFEPGTLLRLLAAVLDI